MFCYKNHRLNVHKVSFQIPDGYFINTVPGMEADDFIHLESPDHGHIVDVRFYQNCAGPKEELVSVVEGMNATMLRPVTDVEVGGLLGCHATYRMVKSQYYELWLISEPGIAMCIGVNTEDEILNVDVAAIVAAIDPQRGTE